MESRITESEPKQNQPVMISENYQQMSADKTKHRDSPKSFFKNKFPQPISPTPFIDEEIALTTGKQQGLLSPIETKSS